MDKSGLLTRYKDFIEVFDAKNAKRLPNYIKHNHIIDLVEGVEPLYKLIYSLLAIKLGVLREYIDENLYKEWI